MCIAFRVYFHSFCNCFSYEMSVVFKGFFHVYMMLLICYFAANWSSIRLLLRFWLRFLTRPKFLWLFWEQWSQGNMYDLTISAFLEQIVESVPTKDTSWIFNVSFEVCWWLGFAFSFYSYSLQMSSVVLQNRSKHLEKVHVVLGNKSCDLDCLISALAYAYFLDKVMRKTEGS